MEPLERLLNLVGLLLDTDKPLTFDEIRATLAEYGGDNPASAKRKFERDKDILREFGVPLTMRGTDVWDTEQGYIIPKEEYYLPDITFEPDEIAALFVAAQSGTEVTAATQGVRKLLYGADGGVLVGLQAGPLLVGPAAGAADALAAADAAATQRRITFGYRNARGAVSEREVDAYAAVFRGGRWYLVGFDRDRDEIRAFRLSRLTSGITDAGEGTPPPQGFRATDHVEGGPWEPTGDERAVVAFGADAAVLAGSQFPRASRRGTDAGGRVVMEIPAVDSRSLAPLVLRYGPEAEVIEPESLRAEMIARLEEIAGA
jgi:predicted DNA-binding transcriptional regulator YafY